MPESYTDWRDKFYRRDIDEIVSRLHRLADEVAANSLVREPGVMGTPPYTDAAQRVVHTVMWGVANLSLDGLITSAAAADKAREEGSS